MIQNKSKEKDEIRKFNVDIDRISPFKTPLLAHKSFEGSASFVGLLLASF